MPLGAPFHTVPKSGCSGLSSPIDVRYACDLRCTGNWEISVFHGLSGGRISSSPNDVLSLVPASGFVPAALAFAAGGSAWDVQHHAAAATANPNDTPRATTTLRGLVMLSSFALNCGVPEPRACR